MLQMVEMAQIVQLIEMALPVGFGNGAERLAVKYHPNVTNFVQISVRRIWRIIRL